jgi:lipid-binding SYLF domain-containing protein
LILSAAWKWGHTPGAKALADKAVAVLVFPSIVKEGFIIAG